MSAGTSADRITVLIHAKVDYGIRALLALAETSPRPATTEALAAAQQLPARFLGAILTELKKGGIVISQRGGGGGYQLARTASAITVGEVIRAIDGPLTEVRGRAPEEATYFGAAAHLGEVWMAVQATMDELLDCVSLEDVVSGRVPAPPTRALGRHGDRDRKPMHADGLSLVEDAGLISGG